jgi:hypothetical protein
VLKEELEANEKLHTECERAEENVSNKQAKPE